MKKSAGRVEQWQQNGSETDDVWFGGGGTNKKKGGKLKDGKIFIENDQNVQEWVHRDSLGWAIWS